MNLGIIMQPFVISSFYKFTNIPNFESFREPILNGLKKHHILGTVILASEGINGTVSASHQDIKSFYNLIAQFDAFSDMIYKETFHDSIPFDKAKVKFRKEIVTMGVEGVNPIESTGEHVSPEDWNKLITDPETVLIDTRNDYEIGLGTFERAINPNTKNFREFPDYVQKELMDKKEKNIAMFCTGGVRCEKSTAYLKNLGFKKVYQLDGGILNYLEHTPADKSLWKGTCFVFDDRIAIEKD